MPMENPNYPNIGEQCLQQRKRQQLTQTQAALKAGIARRYISEIERNKFRGALWILNRYLQLLGLELTVRSHKRPSWDQLDQLFSEG